jgi:hypothetical protein
LRRAESPVVLAILSFSSPTSWNTDLRGRFPILLPLFFPTIVESSGSCPGVIVRLADSRRRSDVTVELKLGLFTFSLCPTSSVYFTPPRNEVSVFASDTITIKCSDSWTRDAREIAQQDMRTMKFEELKSVMNRCEIEESIRTCHYSTSIKSEASHLPRFPPSTPTSSTRLLGARKNNDDGLSRQPQRVPQRILRFTPYPHPD